MMMGWKGKRVVVIGAARQGVALSRFLVSQGAQVVLNDQRKAEELSNATQSLSDIPPEKIRWIFGGHPFEVLDGADLVCLSGGISISMPLVVEARGRGIPLSNDSQIFLEVAPCRVIGITGSAGKTTTTTLVGRMAQAAIEQENVVKNNPSGRISDNSASFYPSKVWVGGNIGSPLITSVDKMSLNDLAVMELSSFQLEIMDRSPQVAAILNITPNHLDRHPTMEAYTTAKARILDYQTPDDVSILGRDDRGAWDLAEKVKGRLYSFGMLPLDSSQNGTYCRDGSLYLKVGDKEYFLMDRFLILLRGEHNLLNVLAASAVCAAADLPIAAMRAGVEGFRGVPHRLELVRTWKGVSWYNDSIATAPERSIAAIRSFEEPLVLLAGGRDKNLPWGDFATLVRQRIDHLVLFGEAAYKIEQAVEAVNVEENDRPFTLTRCKGLQQAVMEARRVAEPGDVVLLSPGGTSFDEFRDFEERGEAFRQWVMDLV